MLYSHRELASTAREVVLEYTSVLLDRETRIRIMPSGTWVWLPDAEKILSLQHLASCRGPDRSVKRPFFRGQPSESAKRDIPVGPPV